MHTVKNYIVYSAIAISVFVVAAYAAPDDDDFKLYIRLDKQYFYADEEIQLKIYVKNYSNGYRSFNIFDKREGISSNYTTFQPVVYDMQGREAEIIVPHVTEDQDMENILSMIDKREVQLAPGEMIVHSVNLHDIYKLEVNRKYRVKGYFFPNYTEDFVIQSENHLLFSVKKANIPERREKRVTIERGLSPNEIILLVLNAEKNEEFQKMTKYLDISKYIQSFPNFVRRYQEADYNKKLLIEQEFITFLSKERDDYILDFKLINEEIDTRNKTAYVEVIVDRFGFRRTNRYKYRYTLEKKPDTENLWLVTGIDATVMKGIQR